MIAAYIVSGLLLFVSYFTQGYILSTKDTVYIAILGIYVALIPWSIVAETVYFSSTIASFKKGVKKSLFYEITLLIKDIFFLIVIVVIAILYIYYRNSDSGFELNSLIFINIFLLLTMFTFRIMESRVRAALVRLGVSDYSLVIVNSFGILKWLFILLNGIYIGSESIFYLFLIVVSLLSIFIMTKKIDNKKLKEIKLESDSNKNLIYAVIFGTLTFQLDKFFLLYSQPNFLNKEYLLLFSMTFIIIQGLAPVFNRYISDLWLYGTKNSTGILLSYGSIIFFLSFVMVLFNLTILINLGGDVYDYDIALLSLAVILHAGSHIFYFNFLSKKLFKETFFQNIYGFIFSALTVLIVVLNDLTFPSLIVFFGALGQFIAGAVIHQKRFNDFILVKSIGIILSYISLASIYYLFLIKYELSINKGYSLILPFIFIYIASVIVNKILHIKILDELKNLIK